MVAESSVEYVLAVLWLITVTRVNTLLLMLLGMDNPWIVLASLTCIFIILRSWSDLLLILTGKAEGLIDNSEAICIVLIMLGLCLNSSRICLAWKHLRRAIHKALIHWLTNIFAVLEDNATVRTLSLARCLCTSPVELVHELSATLWRLVNVTSNLLMDDSWIRSACDGRCSSYSRPWDLMTRNHRRYEGSFLLINRVIEVVAVNFRSQPLLSDHLTRVCLV